eukprot:6800010-Prymnesium_polylepis.1
MSCAMTTVGPSHGARRSSRSRHGATDCTLSSVPRRLSCSPTQSRSTRAGDPAAALGSGARASSSSRCRSATTACAVRCSKKASGEMRTCVALESSRASFSALNESSPTSTRSVAASTSSRL